MLRETYILVQTTTKRIYHVSAYVLRLHVLRWYVNTFLQRITTRLCQKNQGLSVVSGSPDVMRDKQVCLIM